ncbi:hypothetical protein [Rhizobium sp. EC-SD404]|uniref:hypothetical protein n=1 Tax=Rhizobium sp. EC-SD404 TaxID=2038389 RepID=UPI0012550173|nr:hypothetical protein [Rhizobium sp. EC-SD404]VVT04725.1 conserved hypothetical protein [Rhizobium sp. EC-SD404]
MTIAERQAREAHDRENPWRQMNERRRPGLMCNLMIQDRAGHHDTERLYVEMDLGKWWDVDANSPVYHNVLNWRAAYITMSKEVRDARLRRYEEGLRS